MFPPLVFVLSLVGCASVNVLMLSSETFSSQASEVEILEQFPTRPYVQIAELTVDSFWLGLDSKRQKILEKAATLGADAVVFREPQLTPMEQGHRTAEQSPPSIPSPPKDLENAMPDLRSSTQDPLGAEVRVVLVRGGGHGGRGGHPGRGGRWGGRFGHRGYLYAPYYGPRYWGYGFYGPGSWGYAPYWRGYPYWGPYAPYTYGPYPGYGYGLVNTVTIGTAIHYTDYLSRVQVCEREPKSSSLTCE